jgi:mannan endo-1,4-beta-mannosidase
VDREADQAVSSPNRRTGKAIAILAPPAILAALLFTVFRHDFAALWAKPRPAANRSSAPHPALRTPGFLVGVFEPRIPGPWAPIAQFATATGTSPNLILYYASWGDPFRYGFAKTAAEHGASVLVQIQPWSARLKKIAAGRDDPYLRSYARAVRTFHQPVVIGFAHEMNGRWYPWGYGHQPASAFVAAWRHIVTVFRQQHAANVRWLWTVSSGVGRPLRQWWPGRRYVTWVGIDGYYYQRGQHFGSAFGRTIRRVRKLTKAPILLSEAGIGQIAGQARTMPDLFAGIRRDHLLGLVWFDVAQHAGTVHQDWRLEGHPAALAEFRRGVRNLEPSG